MLSWRLFCRVLEISFRIHIITLVTNALGWSTSQKILKEKTAVGGEGGRRRRGGVLSQSSDGHTVAVAFLLRVR